MLLGIKWAPFKLRGGEWERFVKQTSLRQPNLTKHQMWEHINNFFFLFIMPGNSKHSYTRTNPAQLQAIFSTFYKVYYIIYTLWKVHLFRMADMICVRIPRQQSVFSFASDLNTEGHSGILTSAQGPSASIDVAWVWNAVRCIHSSSGARGSAWGQNTYFPLH